VGGQVVLNLADVPAPLEAATPFQGSGHFPATRTVARLEQPTTLKLQVGATGRAPFGEILELKLSPDRE
jgi:hypothetical protein